MAESLYEGVVHMPVEDDRSLEGAGGYNYSTGSMVKVRKVASRSRRKDRKSISSFQNCNLVVGTFDKDVM